MIFCWHDYDKQEQRPHHTYYSWDGYLVGVFLCKCRKCGKYKNMKFY